MTTLVARPARSHLADQRHQSVAVAHFRLMLLMLLFIGAVGAVSVRLVWLTFVADGPAARSAIGRTPARADIIDRNGEPLAQTVEAWSIGIHPKKVLGDRNELAEKLAELMPERSDADYRRILNSKVNFTYLRRRALPELVDQVNALGEPAVALAREPERFYPQTTLAAQVLGYTNRDGKGAAGMERVLDERLSDPALRGKPVQLAIDMRVQAAMESELYAAMQKHSALGAAGLILDVDTGEVVAMASMPVYNPNKVPAIPADAQVSPLRNAVTQSVYELGSTFKPLTIAAALDTGVVPSLAKRYDATSPVPIGRFRIKDDHPLNRWLNIPETLVHSSNIATARIADEMGQARMEHLFRSVHFDGPPDIELKERGSSLWPVNWGRATTLTTSYGHGIAVTPLQLASAYAALVNGGIWRPATLYKIEPGKAPKGSRVFTADTSEKMRHLLRLVVTEGTGRRADAPGFRVGGKTGTAEKAQAGGYSHSRNVSTFAAVFPMDRPRYVVIAMLDAPVGTSDTYGFTSAAWTAAPVISRTIARAGPMLGVMPGPDLDNSELQAMLAKDKGH